jgi:hypothetical protein
MGVKLTPWHNFINHASTKQPLACQHVGGGHYLFFTVVNYERKKFIKSEPDV